MVTIDAHCHAGVNWFEPVEMILHQMNLNGVAKAVLIQHGGNYDNRYLLESVKRFPGRFAAVVGVDPTSPAALSDLERLAKEEGVAGVRLRPGDRSPGPDPLAIWRKAAELGLPVSCFTVNVDQIAARDFMDMVEAIPRCTFVLEHLAGVYLSASPDSAKPPFNAYKTALTLSRHPNVYLKFGGLGEISARRPRLQPQFGFDSTPPLLQMAFEAFGARRLMWGSDYPPVSGREGYKNALQGVIDHCGFLTAADREWAFGKAAASVWKLDAS